MKYPTCGIQDCKPGQRCNIHVWYTAHSTKHNKFVFFVNYQIRDVFIGTKLTSYLLFLSSTVQHFCLIWTPGKILLEQFICVKVVFICSTLAKSVVFICSTLAKSVVFICSTLAKSVVFICSTLAKSSIHL